jgi:hypothetical protein
MRLIGRGFSQAYIDATTIGKNGWKPGDYEPGAKS